MNATLQSTEMVEAGLATMAFTRVRAGEEIVFGSLLVAYSCSLLLNQQVLFTQFWDLLYQKL